MLPLIRAPCRESVSKLIAVPVTNAREKPGIETAPMNSATGLNF